MSLVFFVLGVICMVLGLFGIFRFKTFYARLMASTLIDTAGYLCFLIGVILHFGWNTTSIKLLFLFFAVLVINPIFTHFLIQSSWKSGHKEDVKDDPNGGAA